MNKPSDAARHLWEQLHTCPSNERAWAIIERAFEEVRKPLLDAIREHHAQKADDRCWMDDDDLYAAAGLTPGDRRVGDKAAMLQNCRRFIEARCAGGGWPTYAELERQRDDLLRTVNLLAAALEKVRPYLSDHVAMTCGDDFSGPGDRLALDAVDDAIAKVNGATL